MLRLAPAPVLALFGLALTVPCYAIDAARDFSGKWFLDAASSNTRELPMPADTALTVAQQDVSVRRSSTGPDGAVAQWSYLLDGTETRTRVGDETRSSIAKWEGAALLINTQISASQDYTVMDRWELSADRSALTIHRQVVRKIGKVEGLMVYRHEATGSASSGAAAVTSTVSPTAAVPLPSEQPVLIREQPDQPLAGTLTVPSGTRVALSLRNGLDTKHTHEGDRVYLETIAPIAADGKIVIPRGSYVNGTVTQYTPAHGIKGKGEMYIRFDSLMLPNGVSRDFHSRLVSADSTVRGQVDSQEGKITGERDGSSDARTVATGGGIGAGVGAIAGSAAGHPLGGVGIGAAAGSGVALATIFHGKRPEAVLPRGTIVEMILDRNLNFSPNELW